MKIENVVRQPFQFWKIFGRHNNVLILNFDLKLASISLDLFNQVPGCLFTSSCGDAKDSIFELGNSPN